VKKPGLKGFDRFRSAVIAVVSKDFDSWSRSKKKLRLLNNEVNKHLFGTGDPTPPNKPTPKSRYFQMIMHHVSEISTSFDMMSDIEFYMGRFPYRGSKIPKNRHLQFHVEAYLHEVYVLQQRESVV
jgi:hypothetical protein